MMTLWSIFLEQEDIMKERNGMGSVDLVEVHGGEAFIKQVSGQSRLGRCFCS